MILSRHVKPSVATPTSSTKIETWTCIASKFGRIGFEIFVINGSRLVLSLLMLMLMLNAMVFDSSWIKIKVVSNSVNIVSANSFSSLEIGWPGFEWTGLAQMLPIFGSKRLLLELLMMMVMIIITTAERHKWNVEIHISSHLFQLGIDVLLEIVIRHVKIARKEIAEFKCDVLVSDFNCL